MHLCMRVHVLPTCSKDELRMGAQMNKILQRMNDNYTKLSDVEAEALLDTDGRPVRMNIGQCACGVVSALISCWARVSALGAEAPKPVSL